MCKNARRTNAEASVCTKGFLGAGRGISGDICFDRSGLVSKEGIISCKEIIWPMIKKYPVMKTKQTIHQILFLVLFLLIIWQMASIHPRMVHSYFYPCAASADFEWPANYSGKGVHSALPHRKDCACPIWMDGWMSWLGFAVAVTVCCMQRVVIKFKICTHLPDIWA